MRASWKVVFAAAVAGGLAGCAAGDSVPISTGRFEENSTLATLSGSGIIAREKEPIAYRPRSPLVLPQKYELRNPESAQAVTAANPAWPRDPDVERKRRSREAEAVSLEDYRRQKGVPDDKRQLLMMPDEMERGRRAGAGVITEPVVDKRDHDVMLLPSQFQRKKSAQEAEEERIAATTPEAPRKYLTEPPSGYRVPVAATTPEGKAAAEEALKARQAKPQSKGWASWLGL